MKEQGRRLLAWSVILLVLAAAAYGTLRLAYGQRPAYVHVRWSASVDAATRAQLERAHSLTRGALRERRTWGYYITDLSSQNIQDLVGNPLVEDTHNIHRTAFRIWRTAPRDAYLSSRPAWIAGTLEFLGPTFLAMGALALVVGLFKVKNQRSKVKS